MKDTTETLSGAEFGRASSNVSSAMRARIVSAVYGKGEFLPTVRELIKEFSVSSGTICRALKVIEEDGLIVARPRHGYEVLYQGDMPGQGIPIGFVSRMQWETRKFDQINQVLLPHLQQASAQQGWSLLCIDYFGRPPGQVVDDLLAAKTWGVIVDAYDPDIIRLARQAGITVVAIDAWHPDLEVDSIVQDDFNGGFLAAQYLAGRGHKNIGWFRCTSTTNHTINRLGGAIMGLRQNGLKFNDAFVVDEETEDIDDRIRGILSRPDRPTAFLTLWIDETLALLRVARELKLKPGRDFEVVGWCAEEVFEQGILGHLNGGYIPPLITWRMKNMVQAATLRLAERRTNPELPAMRINIEARLKLPGKTGRRQ